MTACTCYVVMKLLLRTEWIAGNHFSPVTVVAARKRVLGIERRRHDSEDDLDESQTRYDRVP